MFRVLRVSFVLFIINNNCESQSTEKLPKKCGLMKADEKITNGVNASLGQFPFMALLGYTRKVNEKVLPQFICGGTIINEYYVLTAAHCFRASLTFIRLGELDTRSNIDCEELNGFTHCGDPFLDIPIEKKVIHENYNPINFKNDIALVKASNKIKFSDYIQPICLPFNFNSNLTGTLLTASGWGTTASISSIHSSTLQYAFIRAWETKNCDNSLSSEVRPLKDTQICGNGANGQDACRGDSGGPLFTVRVAESQPRYLQVGVTSFGATGSCGNSELPSVYTNVVKYVDWIVENIE
ncbi:Trypsin [Oryctes borbonicus]|uniref:Trypsin n=1 Tax=Oryctes borbonicus TaxID=1629725 RepID=A0A0T6B4B7_9SCAR|nr:Trypsin [Oryctes borbonicus]